MSQQIEFTKEYIYVTIPTEYVCLHHKILVMLADYGEDMLKDCKAACKDRNSTVIDCFNMFNAAVAARKLGKDKLAETIFKYVEAKVKQIYKGEDNANGLVYPIDDQGYIKALVTCGEHPILHINSDNGELVETFYEEVENNMSEDFYVDDENLLVV